MLFSIESTARLVMYHYCPTPSVGLQSPRDKKQARSSNSVPQALNALFHRPHKMDLCARLHWRAKENQYPWHIMLRIIPSLSNYNNLTACLTFAHANKCLRHYPRNRNTHANIICVTHAQSRQRSSAPLASSHTRTICEHTPACRGRGENAIWFEAILHVILMKCKLN